MNAVLESVVCVSIESNIVCRPLPFCSAPKAPTSPSTDCRFLKTLFICWWQIQCSATRLFLETYNPCASCHSWWQQTRKGAKGFHWRFRIWIQNCARKCQWVKTGRKKRFLVFTDASVVSLSLLVSVPLHCVKCCNKLKVTFVYPCVFVYVQYLNVLHQGTGPYWNYEFKELIRRVVCQELRRKMITARTWR